MQIKFFHTLRVDGDGELADTGTTRAMSPHRNHLRIAAKRVDVGPDKL